MKILIWSQYFWPENFVINEIAEKLTEKNHKVYVLTGKPNYPKGTIYKGYKWFNIVKENIKRIEITRIPIVPRMRGTTLGICLNYLSFILSGFLFSPFLFRKKKIDVIFVYATSPLLQALPAIFLSIIKKIPLVLWVQDLWPESITATGHLQKNFYILGIIKKLVGFCYNRSNIILVQSPAFISSIQNNFKTDKIIKYLPNPSFDYKYDPEKTYELNKETLLLLQDMSKYFSLVYGGNIGKAQSIDTILKAAEILQKYSKIKIFLIGTGSMEIEVAETIKHKALANVSLILQKPKIDMIPIYSMAAGLIISLNEDICFQNTIPSKLQSYFSTGKPVLGCISGTGKNLILKAKAGLCVSAKDASGLAQIIEDFYYLPSKKRQSLGLNGRLYYEKNFTTEIIIRKIESTIRSFSQ